MYYIVIATILNHMIGHVNFVITREKVIKKHDTKLKDQEKDK